MLTHGRLLIVIEELLTFAISKHGYSNSSITKKSIRCLSIEQVNVYEF
tara:strand:- start:181 stop:324 length:144 start_codon:yes stop_codon:yes gene_type:complete